MFLTQCFKLIYYLFVSPYFQNSVLAVAGDDEFVRLCDLGDGDWLFEFKAHETRLIDSFHHRYSLSSGVI